MLQYCAAVMEHLDPGQELVSHHLSRQHCTLEEGNIYVKDLGRLGRDLRNTVLLDNNPDAYLYHQVCTRDTGSVMHTCTRCSGGMLHNMHPTSSE